MNWEENSSTLKVDDLEIAQQVLAENIARQTKEEDQLATAIPRLIFRRFETPTEPLNYMLDQSVCLIAQEWQS